ncbi:kynurenine aminotransferase-like isoform X1 [Diorhabda sublineata]|uniref:kynurenine aminotransferase-like isoform X1 n=2 Tax=Diorhabda sublineata TaxID=1163346 RepID=UPI0024E0845B|nr:kynurenine aminotransferase-like isoform X1 [Diorhabda sublineata]
MFSQINMDKNFLKEYGELCINYNVTDVAMGCPDYKPASFVENALNGIVHNHRVFEHQYTDPNGYPSLVHNFSKVYSQLLNKNLTKEEILITAGSSEALFCAVLSLVSPGDEVIIFEPFFMVFETLVKMAQGFPKYSKLKWMNINPKNQTSADWKVDQEELSQLFNEKTKVVIVNTPHNPTGKVFTYEELTIIADLCKKWDVICIADEVYEHMVYKPCKHIRIATLPDMFERTVTIGACEKSFGVTGWQVGFAYGDQRLIEKLQTLHQYTVFSACTPIQAAFAKIFQEVYDRMMNSKSYFELFGEDLKEKRDYFLKNLHGTDFNPIVPEGGMYVMIDISKHVAGTDLSEEQDTFLDEKFIKRLVKKHSLKVFPLTISCTKDNKKKFETFIRICFVKELSTLDSCLSILKRFGSVEQELKENIAT